jgi:hypothetical protein
MTSEIRNPGEPGDYLTNNVQLAEGSVMKMEDGSADVVTWLLISARDTASPDNTVVHSYAFNDEQFVALAAMLVRHAQRRGLLP